MLNFELTEEQKTVVETVRAFAARELAPQIAELDREKHYDPMTFVKFRELGLTGISVPEEYGGAGMDYLTLGLVCEELEYVDTSFRTILSIHLGLCGSGIYQWGTEAQKRRFLTPLARGEKLGAFGLTEPGAGSDVAGITTRAKRSGSDYLLSGQKMWISGAQQAGTFLIFAYTEPEKKHDGISAFIVDRGEAGQAFSTFTIHDKAGIWAGNVGGINLDDVRVPRENLLGEEGEGFKIAMGCLDNGRYTVAAGATGLIRACLDASVQYAKERLAFGKPIAEFQLVQDMIAQMVASYDAARLLYLKAGWLKNQGIRSSRESSLAKWFATTSADTAANHAVEIFGAYGYSDEYPVARFLRNAKGPVIYEGTRQVHKLIQAQYALGLRKDKPLRCPLPSYRPRVPVS
ncbi:MAG: acyl-CoA dehydrogenase family protein [Cyanobacteria bacterium NC_groundwater_1444_Ag_S-0.65um_54_12]|nr:acyl-CoA dehydrogenase family protein [Cyanobacteria bacterium NC_groundwater_1444_Ag_S-0.65um_54_12]